MNTQTENRAFEALFSNAAIGIIIVDQAGSIVMANQFALIQFGYQHTELDGQKIEILIPGRYKEKHAKYRDGYAAEAHNRPMGLGMDLYAIKKNGTEFPVEVSLSPYQTEVGQYSIAFISDISIRKQSQNELLKLNADLELKVKTRTLSLTQALEKEKELNELKSRFVSMASHEFRTPLSTILSSIYLVSKYTTAEDQPKRDKHIQRIVSSVDMLTETLNDFLSVGKIEEGKIQVRHADVDIRQLIDALINEMHPLLKPAQQLRYNHTGGSLFGLDPSLLKHIVMNLVSNAIKFSAAGTVIQIVSAITSDYLSISVKDAGIGISLTDQEHLFERFFRGANVTNIQGTGLGLHIVAKYTELMNGTIRYESKIGEGTEFIINFKRINREQ